MLPRSLPGIVVGFLLTGCAAHTVERETWDPHSPGAFERSRIEHLRASSPYLKAHMKNGNVYLFDSWNIDQRDSIIVGHAILFSPFRDTLGNSRYSIGLDTIALLETNVVRNSGSATAMTIFMGITAAFTINCIANPKSCFGSCPTMYVDDGAGPRLQAEGFSSSIAPSLEAVDIDAIHCGTASNGQVTVIMKNEALETHVVRYVDLLAAPRATGCRVFVTPDQIFWESTAQLSPVAARGPEGDCLPHLLKVDGDERYSPADGHYLGAKEEIELEFAIQPDKSYGLVLGCRQTLLPTYLLYQTFAYMGNDAGNWFAQLERNTITMPRGIADLIGGIEVFISGPDDRRIRAGAIEEQGPLAVDTHLIPLPATAGATLTVHLRMTKGTWRLERAGLAELSHRVEPTHIHPTVVMKDGAADIQGREALIDPSKTLTTLPGDEYRLTYTLPATHPEYELFLESRGYYLEWMRKEWIDEENPVLLAQIITEPEAALKRMAPEFKRLEPTMEDCFWRSRYAKP